MTAPDPVQRYLTELRTSLRTADVGRILAEAEDHLRETVTAGLAAGLSRADAQEAAISAFGSVRAVVRAHQSRPGHLFRGRSPRAVLGDLMLSAWRLGATGLVAIGASGVVVALMNATLGRSFVGQAPPGTVFSRADCAYWMAGWPGAHTCATAAMLEASSDAVVLRLIAGLAGLAALGAYGIARRAWRGPAVPLAGYFSLLGAAVFSAGALALAMAQLTGFTVTGGPGTYLSGALVAAAIAVYYGARARPALSHLLMTRVRRAR